VIITLIYNAFYCPLLKRMQLTYTLGRET